MLTHCKSSRGLSPSLTPPYVPFMAYGGFSARDWSRNCCSCRNSLSLLVRYPDNSSAPLRGFGLAPLSIPRSRFRTFQYFLALLLYVLRLEWLPTPDSALPTPHYCDAVAFGYLIPPCQRLIGDSHPSYVSCLTYKRNGRVAPAASPTYFTYETRLHLCLTGSALSFTNGRRNR